MKAPLHCSQGEPGNWRTGSLSVCELILFYVTKLVFELSKSLQAAEGQRASRHTHSAPVGVVPLCSARLQFAALLAEGPIQGGALVRRHDGESSIRLHQTHH